MNTFKSKTGTQNDKTNHLGGKKKQISERIDQELEKLRRVQEKTVKIILLGAGESGKSTVLKQMKIIHGKGFGFGEGLFFRRRIYAGIVNAVKDICLTAIEEILEDIEKETDAQNKENGSEKYGNGGSTDRNNNNGSNVYDNVGGQNHKKNDANNNENLINQQLKVDNKKVSIGPDGIKYGDLNLNDFFMEYLTAREANTRRKLYIAASKSKEIWIIHHILSLVSSPKYKFVSMDVPPTFEIDYIEPLSFIDNDLALEIARLLLLPTVGKLITCPPDNFKLDSGAAHFLFDLALKASSGGGRLTERDYLPTNDDILHARVRTSGVSENSFETGDLIYRIIDVGGQRSERKKWINYFDDVNTVVFVVSLADYNKVCAEDDETNRLQESLTLFDSIVNNASFRDSSFVLFLNKVDLFESMLHRVPLRKFLPGYNGDNHDPEAAKKYICDLFLSRIKFNHQHSISVHYTCAIDTDQLSFVMDSVINDILQTRLSSLGIV